MSDTGQFPNQNDHRRPSRPVSVAARSLPELASPEETASKSETLAVLKRLRSVREKSRESSPRRGLAAFLPSRLFDHANRGASKSEASEDIDPASLVSGTAHDFGEADLPEQDHAPATDMTGFAPDPAIAEDPPEDPGIARAPAAEVDAGEQDTGAAVGQAPAEWPTSPSQPATDSVRLYGFSAFTSDWGHEPKRDATERSTPEDETSDEDPRLSDDHEDMGLASEQAGDATQDDAFETDDEASTGAEEAEPGMEMEGDAHWMESAPSDDDAETDVEPLTETQDAPYDAESGDLDDSAEWVTDAAAADQDDPAPGIDDPETETDAEADDAAAMAILDQVSAQITDPAEMQTSAEDVDFAAGDDTEDTSARAFLIPNEEDTSEEEAGTTTSERATESSAGTADETQVGDAEALPSDPWDSLIAATMSAETRDMSPEAADESSDLDTTLNAKDMPGHDDSDGADATEAQVGEATDDPWSDAVRAFAIADDGHPAEPTVSDAADSEDLPHDADGNDEVLSAEDEMARDASLDPDEPTAEFDVADDATDTEASEAPTEDADLANAAVASLDTHTDSSEDDVSAARHPADESQFETEADLPDIQPETSTDDFSLAEVSTSEDADTSADPMRDSGVAAEAPPEPEETETPTEEAAVETAGIPAFEGHGTAPTFAEEDLDAPPDLSAMHLESADDDTPDAGGDLHADIDDRSDDTDDEWALGLTVDESDADEASEAEATAALGALDTDEADAAEAMYQGDDALDEVGDDVPDHGEGGWETGTDRSDHDDEIAAAMDDADSEAGSIDAAHDLSEPEASEGAIETVLDTLLDPEHQVSPQDDGEQDETEAAIHAGTWSVDPEALEADADDALADGGARDEDVPEPVSDAGFDAHVGDTDAEANVRDAILEDAGDDVSRESAAQAAFDAEDDAAWPETATDGSHGEIDIPAPAPAAASPDTADDAMEDQASDAVEPAQRAFVPTLAADLRAADDLDGPGRKPRIALMGEFSAGKSTLSNLLIGANPLPTKVTATQLPPVWISYGEGVPYREDIDGETHPIALEELAYIDPARTRMVRLFAKSDTLELCDIIDMPGISDPNMDSQVWERMIDKADGVIWCTHATQAWRQSEAAVWEMLDPDLQAKSLLLVTRFDKLHSDKDRSRVLKRLRRETEGLFRDCLPISLLDALSSDGDQAKWEASGADAFSAALMSVLNEMSDTLGQPRRGRPGRPLSQFAPRHRTETEVQAPGDAGEPGAPVAPRRVVPRRISQDAARLDPPL